VVRQSSLFAAVLLSTFSTGWEPNSQQSRALVALMGTESSQVTRGQQALACEEDLASKPKTNSQSHPFCEGEGGLSWPDSLRRNDWGPSAYIGPGKAQREASKKLPSSFQEAARKLPSSFFSCSEASFSPQAASSSLLKSSWRKLLLCQT
jgi:hypothetical protein